MREAIIPLFVIDDAGTGPHLDQLATVRSFMDYRATPDFAELEGTVDLRATGQGGDTRRLRCTYVDGMEGAEGASVGGGSNWSMFDVKLLAVDPYWHGVEWSTPVVQLPGAAPFLSNNAADGFPRQITASVAIGEDMTVRVPGDVPSPAVVELLGPADATVITSPSGLNVTIGALAAGEQFVLDTGRTKRALLNGVPAWELVGQSPQWRPLTPGSTTISVEVVGANDQTRARVYGTALWETAW